MLGSIGPTELILLFLILLITVVPFLGYRWSKKRSERASLGMPMKWYYFYTYWRLPLTILSYLGLLAYMALFESIKVSVGLMLNGRGPEGDRDRQAV